MGLKKDLESQLNVSPRIRWGGPGQLDVPVDGKLVFSKKAVKRMPTPGEIAGLIRNLQRH